MADEPGLRQVSAGGNRGRGGAAAATATVRRARLVSDEAEPKFPDAITAAIIVDSSRTGTVYFEVCTKHCRRGNKLDDNECYDEYKRFFRFDEV